MVISKEQFEEYIKDNWSNHFFKALVEVIRQELFYEDVIEKRNYAEEVKGWIYEAITDGVKEYLNEYEGEAIKIIANEFLEKFSDRQISIHFE